MTTDSLILATVNIVAVGILWLICAWYLGYFKKKGKSE